MSTSMSRQILHRDLADPMSTASSAASISAVASAWGSAQTNDTDDTATNRTSWVWQYFSQVKQGGIVKNMCCANKGVVGKVNDDPDAPVVVCNEPIAVDKNASTKSMIHHLSCSHHIEKPIETSQQTLTGFVATGRSVNVSLLFLSFFICYPHCATLTDTFCFQVGTAQQEKPHQCSYPAYCTLRAPSLACGCPQIPWALVLDQSSSFTNPVKTNCNLWRYSRSILSILQSSQWPFLVSGTYQYQVWWLDITQQCTNAWNYGALDVWRVFYAICSFSFEGNWRRAYRSKHSCPRQEYIGSVWYQQ